MEKLNIRDFKLTDEMVNSFGSGDNIDYEELGRFVVMALNYMNGKEPVKGNEVSLTAYRAFKRELLHQRETKKSMIIRNRINGKKGGRPRKKK